MSKLNGKSIRERVLASATPPPKPVDIDGWGTVYIRTITVAEVIDQTKDVADPTNYPALARAVCRALVDQDNERQFDPQNADDIATILKLPWPPTRRFLEASREHNQLGDIEAGKA